MKTKLATTREELQELEKKEFGAVGACINWQLMDRLIQEGREFNEQIKDLFKPKDKPKVYAYSTQGQLLGVYDNQTVAAKAYGLAQGNVSYSIREKRPVWSARMYFTDEMLDNPPTFVEEQIRRKTGEYTLYVYSSDKRTLLNEYESPRKAAEALGISMKKLHYYMHIDKPYFKKGVYLSRTKITVIE